ncbi:MAG: ATP-binding protein [Microbacteriaceae bacterium]|nr:ATP-binding protein [Microbacteriaceae bacterium]
MSLTVMCGLSFSGKSTFAALLAERLDAEIISLDAINAERGLDGGQGIPLEEWGRTNDIGHARAATALQAGRAVVVDDTGSPRFIREGWREVAASARASFSIVWVQIDAERQRERLLANRAEQQRHDVIDEVMAAHVDGFEDPTDENPFVVDADDARNPAVAEAIATGIRQRSR